MASDDVIEIVLGETPYPIPAIMNYGGHAVLWGYSVKESTGSAAAELDIYDQATTGGFLAIPIPLGPGMARENWFGPQGIHFRRGLNAIATIGAVVGSLFISDPPHMKG